MKVVIKYADIENLNLRFEQIEDMIVSLFVKYTGNKNCSILGDADKNCFIYTLDNAMVQ